MTNLPDALSNAQPLRGPFTLWPRAADAVLAALAFMLILVFSLTEPSQPYYQQALTDIPIGAYLIFIVSSGALLRRRQYPLPVFAVILSASLMSIVIGYTDGPVFPLVISLYSVGRYANRERWSYAVAAGTVGLIALCHFKSMAAGKEDGGVFGLVFVILFTFIIWYVGRRIRIRGDYLRLLQERAGQLERERDQEARRAVAEERARIAREMHDVVAHQVSLMTVQAGAAKTVLADNPGDALQAMETVEQAGRKALNELRHLVGMLRPDSGNADLDPQPGLADVPRLIEQLTETGLRISLELDQAMPNLPAHLNLSVYRIVQEALTNVLKHAGPEARAWVSIQKKANQIEISVKDNGIVSNRQQGTGHGIVGMRERAQLLGGWLEAGPATDGGFQVSAVLPLGDEE